MFIINDNFNDSDSCVSCNGLMIITVIMCYSSWKMFLKVNSFSCSTSLLSNTSISIIWDILLYMEGEKHLTVELNFLIFWLYQNMVITYQNCVSEVMLCIKMYSCSFNCNDVMILFKSGCIIATELLFCFYRFLSFYLSFYICVSNQDLKDHDPACIGGFSEPTHLIYINVWLTGLYRTRRGNLSIIDSGVLEQRNK